jgi:hypothetical protein
LLGSDPSVPLRLCVINETTQDEAKSEKDRHHPEIRVLESCDNSKSAVRKTEVSRKGAKRLAVPVAEGLDSFVKKNLIQAF